jgi:hypothetical protein
MTFFDFFGKVSSLEIRITFDMKKREQDTTTLTSGNVTETQKYQWNLLALMKNGIWIIGIHRI